MLKRLALCVLVAACSDSECDPTGIWDLEHHFSLQDPDRDCFEGGDSFEGYIQITETSEAYLIYLGDGCTVDGTITNDDGDCVIDFSATCPFVVNGEDIGTQQFEYRMKSQGGEISGEGHYSLMTDDGLINCEQDMVVTGSKR